MTLILKVQITDSVTGDRVQAEKTISTPEYLWLGFDGLSYQAHYLVDQIFGEQEEKIRQIIQRTPGDPPSRVLPFPLPPES